MADLEREDREWRDLVCSNVPCPNSRCGARVGEWCNTLDTYPHARREQRYERDVVEVVYYTWFESNRSHH